MWTKLATLLTGVIFLILTLGAFFAHAPFPCRHGRLKQGICHCDPGYSGRYCRSRASGVESCGYGIKVANEIGDGECVCNMYWRGESCDEITCVHGYRLRKDVCSCYPGAKGEFCQEALCVHGVYRPSRDGMCVCASGWTGRYCNESQCAYGTKGTDGSCQCIGNYESPLCERCAPGFYGIECKENGSLSRSGRRYTGRGNGALALGLVVGFSVMVCFSAVFLYRCLAVLVDFILRTAREKRTRRQYQTDLTRTDCVGSTLIRPNPTTSATNSHYVDVNKPPSYEQVTNVPPPSYKDVVAANTK